MRVQVVSDLHLDHAPLGSFTIAGDVLVVAGDLSASPDDAYKFLAGVPPDVPCVYVLGNHEHDARPFPAVGEYRQRLATFPNVRLLENESVEIGGVRFAGATLWSRIAAHQSAAVARNLARVDIRSTPAELTALHAASVAWLETALAQPIPTVVVTHMAPSHLSAPPAHVHSPLSSYFATDLEAVIARMQPNLWVHGHMHEPVDYRVARTRIVSNPRGYPGENRQFSSTGRLIDV